MPPCEAVEARVRERASALERFYPKITGCHLVIESHHRHRGEGRNVAVHLIVPEGEIVVKRDPAEHHAHEDVYVAVREAVDAVQRRWRIACGGCAASSSITNRAATARSRSSSPIMGSSVRQLHGFIRSAIDGQDIYFHRNSVLDGKFDRLQSGMEVRFALHEGEGEQGPQASTVTVVG